MSVGTSARAGLYIHIPFCTSVCPYCDFAVLIAGEDRRRSYLDVLESEAARYADLGLQFDTVYLGGGTPSALPPEQLDRILGVVGDRLEIDRDAWNHLEVNPEDVSPETVRRWRGLGFRTISLGVQSFDDDALRFLGRSHTAARARRALAELMNGGFGTVSVDLIYGLPGQTAAGWRRQLDKVVDLAPGHLSCYQLTVHDGTVFGKRRDRGDLCQLPEHRQADLFSLTHSVLADCGYQGYEVSSFAAAPRHRSKHNVKYWDHTPYLGLGPSAHSFVGGRRWWNRRRLRLWQRELDAGRTPVANQEWLSPEQLALEAVMLGLRTADGLDLERLRNRYGVDLVGANRDVVNRFVDSDDLIVTGSFLRPTAKGMAIADTLTRSLAIEVG
jgi:oxygen-independent coproporphyrinogen-3 oxidase